MGKDEQQTRDGFVPIGDLALDLPSAPGRNYGVAVGYSLR